MRFNILFVLCLFVASFVSCSSNDDPEVPEIEKNYKLVSVMWRLEEGDGIEIVEKKLPEKVFSNKTGTNVTVSIDPSDQFDETSYFQCDDTLRLNKGAGENVLVSVPTEYSLLSSEYSYFQGGVSAPLLAGTEKKVESALSFLHETEVASNVKLTYNATVYLRKITATFLARFVSDDGMSDEYEIKGKWSGCFFNNIEEAIVYDDIKP